MLIQIPVSVGEILDKITILLLKELYTQNEKVSKELNQLITIANDKEIYNSEFIVKLYNVNYTLWNVENSLREMEKKQDFSEEFITLARTVYQQNDLRAKIKREINEFYQSEIFEVKVYGDTVS